MKNGKDGVIERLLVAGFLGEKEVLTRERVKEILRKKEYSYLEEKVTLPEVRDDSLLLRISFLIEDHMRMIFIEEKDPIVISLKNEDRELG